jgi:16S rRNA (guanine1207-N2)-methyltransferase
MPQTAHYFSPNPPPAGRTRKIVYRHGGREFTFHTAAGVFSRSGVDAGSRLLLAAIELGGAERILDLGCGYGVLGIVAAAQAPQARVVLVDINPRAVALAEENIARNAVPNVEARCGDGCAPVAGQRFDVILYNPPIRAGRQVVLRLLGEARACLARGGRLYLVARTNQGALTLGRLAGEIFGRVAEIERGSGFRVFEGRDV